MDNESQPLPNLAAVVRLSMPSCNRHEKSVVGASGDQTQVTSYSLSVLFDQIHDDYWIDR